MVSDLDDNVRAEDRFLLLLDPDPGTAEEKYLALYTKLVKYFEWRGAGNADDLAQETLERGFARIAAGTEVYADDPASYFFGIAKNVLREHWKKRVIDHAGDLDTLESPVRGAAGVDNGILLSQCLAMLDPTDRDLFVRYHSGERDVLRNELNVDANNLRVRIHRILERLRRRLEGDLVSP